MQCRPAYNTNLFVLKFLHCKQRFDHVPFLVLTNAGSLCAKAGDMDKVKPMPLFGKTVEKVKSE